MDLRSCNWGRFPFSGRLRDDQSNLFAGVACDVFDLIEEKLAAFMATTKPN